MEWGIIFIIAFSPMAIGGVYPWAYGLMEAMAFFLMGCFLVKCIKGKHRVKESINGNLVQYAWVFPLLFIILASVQLIPLPSQIIRYISPSTYQVYMPVIGRRFCALSLDRFSTRSELLKILSYFCVFLIFVYFPFDDSHKSIKRICLAIMGVGVIVGLIGLIQKFVGTDRIFGLWKPFIKKTKDFYGPFVNPNHFAVYMEMVISLFLGYIAYRFVKRDWNKRGRGIKAWIIEMEGAHTKSLLLFFLAIVLTVSLFFSLSIGGIIIILNAFLFFLVMLYLRRMHAKGFTVLAILFCMLLFFYLAYLGIEPIVKELQALPKIVENISGQSRALAWKDVWKMIKEFPVFGVGLGGFGVIFPKFLSIEGDWGKLIWLYAHNDYLQIWTELGVCGLIFVSVGLILYVLGIIRWVRSRESSHTGREARRYLELGLYTAIFCFLVHSIIGFSFYLPANMMLFVIICGILIRMNRRRKRRYYAIEHEIDNSNYKPLPHNTYHNAEKDEGSVVAQRSGSRRGGHGLRAGFRKGVFCVLLCFSLFLMIAAIKGGFGHSGYKSVGDEQFQEQILKEIPLVRIMPLWNNSPYRHYFLARWYEQKSFVEGVSIEEQKTLLEKAIGELSVALELQPSRSLFWTRLGYLISYADSLAMESLNQPEPANKGSSPPGIDYKGAFTWALHFAPNDARLHYQIGSHLLKRGDVLGLPVLRKAAKLDPSLRTPVRRLIKRHLLMN